MSAEKCNVNLICTSILAEHRSMFEEKGVKCFETNHKSEIFKHRFKILDWCGFRKKAWEIIKKEGFDEDILYICSADTALALGSKLCKKKYVFQSNELYDTFIVYKKMIKKYAINALYFVVPEFIRANICMYWYKLKKMPIVIPNTPYVPIGIDGDEIIDDNAKSVFESIGEKKIILYQGSVSFGDRSLDGIAEALKKINDSSFVLLLMGRNYDNAYEKIKEIYPQTFYIPFVTPPNHLQITSRADIGILTYDRVSLNNIFCAPNKIFEYSAFSVPMLGNNIPGLRNIIVSNNMGECADFEEVDNIAEAILKISNNRKKYSEFSKSFYDKSNCLDSMNKLLKMLEEIAI